MLITTDPNCLFIHVPKTGGSSILTALTSGARCVKNGYGFAALRDFELTKMHPTAVQVRELLPDWSEHFSFGFVRNPWDRMVSWFHAVRNLQRAPSVDVMRTQAAKSFSEFVETVILPSQLDWLCDTDGNQMVDFVGRFEVFDEDWKFICDRFGKRIPLDHYNKSDHLSYQSYYTEETRDLIGQRYAREITLFDYQFAKPD